MKDRIKKIRKDANLTQQAFADRLGLKQNTIAVYEMGKSGISDAVITSICREFNVNEEWLRTGKGNMQRHPGNKLSFYMGQIAAGDDEIIKGIIEFYMELDPTSKKTLKKIAKEAIEKLRDRETN